jgi:hypothetical protein
MVAATRPRPPRTIPERSRRRFRIPRWLIVGVVLSLLALAINSIVATTGEGPDRRLAFLDAVRPQIEESTRQGEILADVRGEATQLGRTGLRRRLERLSRDARRVVDETAAVRVPSALRDSAPLLQASVVARATAVDNLTAALTGALGTGPVDQSVDALVAVGQDLLVADRAYALFVESLPEAVQPNVPGSAWVDDAEQWTEPELVVFVAALRASAALAPVHDVALVTVRLEPSAVGKEADALVLPTVQEVRVVAVVANVGNEAEDRVPVEAVVVSQGGMDVGRQFADLAPGQRLTVPLTLRPSAVGVITLTVRIGVVEGDPTPENNEDVLTFVMR